jgi:hypothetical protein
MGAAGRAVLRTWLQYHWAELAMRWWNTKKK